MKPVQIKVLVGQRNARSMSDKLQPKSADKKLAKSISLNIHRRFGDFSRFRLFTQRVKGQNDEKARGYWVKPHFPNPYRRNWASVCRGLIGKPLVRNWRALLPDRDKLEVCRTFGVA